MQSRIFFIALIGISLAGCGGEKVRNRRTLMYAHLGEVTSLDPVYPYDAVSQGLIYNVYETLIRFKGSSLSEFEPALASKVPSVENGLISTGGATYVFPVRKNVKFHNGGLMTPEDVQYSLLRFMLTDPPGGPASLLLEPVFGKASTRDEKGNIKISKKEIERAVSVSGDNVVVKLKRPFAPFLAVVARWSYVMDKSWCVENGEWDGRYETLGEYNGRTKEKSYLFKNMNGTGAFRLQRWDVNSKQVILSAFEDYWRGPAKIEKIVIKTVSEFGTRRLMLEAGDADIIDIPRTYKMQVKGIKGVKLEDNLPRLMTDPVFFFTFRVNPSANPDIGSGRLDGEGIPPDFFSDKNVRKAFAYSFDYEGFINDALKGEAVRARGSIPPGLPGYDENISAYSYDPSRAADYFRKAYGGKLWEKGFKFTMTFNTGSELRQLACQVLKRNVEKINPKFKVEIRGVDWPVYLEKTQNKRMPLFTRGWTGDYPDPHNFIFPFYHSKGRYPIAQNYSDSEMDFMVEKAAGEVSDAERKKIYGRLQKKAYEDAIQIYTIHPVGLLAMRDWVKGFYDNAVFMGIYFYPIYKK